MTRHHLTSTPLLLALSLTACGAPSSTIPQEPLPVGTLAPDFSLRDAQKPATDPPLTLSTLLRNGPVILIFNMGLHCPACAQDLLAFAAQADDFKNAGIQIIALSHEKPADTRDDLHNNGPIPFPLLFDPDNATARTYGLLAPDGTAEERTYFIDKDRRIQASITPDQPGGEIPDLLALGSKPASPR